VLTAEERYRQYRLGILAQACDEAPIGIWEPYWRANNVLRDLSIEDRLKWAERAMLELMAEGLVQFYRSRGWPSGARWHRLSSDTTAAFIQADAWRRIPLKDAEIWFEATSQGDRRMRHAAQPGEWLGEASVAPGWSPPAKDAKGDPATRE
jgi:hypothetical protein